jgi:post-segregation antitoxin (ccd killing protein)
MEKRESSTPSKTLRERRWLEESRQAIIAYNLRVAMHGLLSDHAGFSSTD